MSAPFQYAYTLHASYNLDVLKLLSHARVYNYYELANYATVLCLQLL